MASYKTYSEACTVSAGSSTDYEPVCGRPHGVRLDHHGQLIIADSYFGLHSVDPKTGEKTLLLANSQGNGVCVVVRMLNEAQLIHNLSLTLLPFVPQVLMAFPSPFWTAWRFPPKLGSFISPTLPVAGDADTSNWRWDEGKGGSVQRSSDHLFRFKSTKGSSRC